MEQNDHELYQFALQMIDNNYKRERFIVKALFILCIILSGITAYLSYTLATTSVVETTTTTTTNSQDLTGAYNFYDSEGNLVSSDLSLDEMKELITLNEEE